MKIGIISDTHDNLEIVQNAVKKLEKEVNTVIHCGDLISPFTAQIFDADFNLHVVRGNNDGEWNLKQTIRDFGEFYNNIAELTIHDKEIAVYHGTEESIVRSLTNSNYDYVLRGHTHKKKIQKHAGTIEINPGGIKLPKQEEEFHYAILNLATGETSFRRAEKDSEA